MISRLGFRDEKFQVVWVFAFFVLISQIVLPAYKKTTLVPFFVWHLYADSPVRWTYFDVEVMQPALPQKPPTFLSSLRQLQNQTEAWENTQRVGEAVLQGHDPDPKLLLAQIKSLGYAPLRLVSVETPFPKYLTFDDQNKKKSTHALIDF